MTSLDPHTADRLTKLCGLFGSNCDGERASAAAKADQLIRAHGLRWRDVIALPPIGTIDKIRFALGHIDVLSRWEHGFLLGIRHKPTLSEKQLAVLDDIMAKIGGKV
jgi:hypothetical protein